MKTIDLDGQRFGRLQVVARAENSPSGKAKWHCLCDCGNEKTVFSGDLRSGATRSCGCLRRETTAMNAKEKAVHNETGTRLYRIWTSMKQRCSNPNSIGYSNYGGRGISVCDEWSDSFMAFRDWSIKNGYKDGLTIDRKDNDKPYSPDNCRWSSMKEQQNNRRNNRMLTYNGKTQTVSMWAEQTGIKAHTLVCRLNAGWPEGDLFIPANLNNARLRKVGNYNAQ